mmetsp:Transcript_8130/g.18296  ORF Transcript_8130/g.18296 Transcript_8130/m.18296 type:complete len:487 (-) Transcript_8130:2245-3705(-)
MSHDAANDLRHRSGRPTKKTAIVDNSPDLPSKTTNTAGSRKSTSRILLSAIFFCIIIETLFYSYHTTTNEDARSGAKSILSQSLQRFDSNFSNHESTDTIIFLNETSPENNSWTNQRKKSSNSYSDGDTSVKNAIDIIIVGTKHKLENAQVQKETWASHPFRRYFFLATEYDDLDPKCEEKYTNEILHRDVKICKSRGVENTNKNNLIKLFKGNYARWQWLQKKSNPAGWICAQRRHSIALAKVTELYSSIGKDILPDYLFIGDDDTYVNLEHILEVLVRQPHRLESKGISQEHSIVPTQDTPVVWAGCRVRWPVWQGNFTFAFGGFGYFFSKASLERLVQPLYCSPNHTVDLTSKYEKSACERLLKPEDSLIGENNYYKHGMSLMDVWKAMTVVEPFCMHADWIFGYFTNFYNISRHVVPGGLNWFDNNLMKETPEARLHALFDSEIYKSPEGLCSNDNSKCPKNATICHRLSSTDLRDIHKRRV